MDAALSILGASRRLVRDLGKLALHAPVDYIYNPLSYAGDGYREYVTRFASPKERALFLGMNPGPWGMAQTGVPFGEISFVRDWMGIEAEVHPPPRTHPRIPVLGFKSTRSEVSGRRFWGLMKERFGSARAFFRKNFVANYCPLMFLDSRGGNLTPDKLSKTDREALYEICDGFLGEIIRVLEPQWIIGIGRFAENRALEAAARFAWKTVRIGGIPHPSPANPGANRDWAGEAARRLELLGAWANGHARRAESRVSP
jgi:single-strand selective monofunctional uracil DNA glycosylase